MVEIIRGQIPEMSRSIKTAIMEYFDDRYTTIAEIVVVAASAVVAATSVGSGWVFQYRDFDNTKPPTFNGIQDPLIAMRCLSNIK